MPVTRNRLRSSTCSAQVAFKSNKNEPSDRSQQQAPLKTASITTTTNSTPRAPAAPSTSVGQFLPKKNFNILIAVTGSVASVKLTELIKRLNAKFPQQFVHKADNRTYEATISIRVLMTENSKHFVTKTDIIKALDANPPEVFDDADEWARWRAMGDPVLHIELRKWADLCVIAPLDANTMAKIANGICDNLLTCVVRAWDSKKSLFYCPAMNVYMYDHPITKDQLCKLQSFGYLRIDCVEKRLACGDVGMGAMASVDTIVDRVLEDLLRPVPKLASPIKSSLLNQQPTYPIMSTSGTVPTSRNVTSVNLQDRFTSSWANFNTRVIGKGTITRNGSSSGQSLLLGAPKVDHLLARSKNAPLLNNINGNTNSLRNLSATRQTSRPSLVKSLKNLKAINPDLLNLSVSDDILDNEDDLGDVSNDDEFFPDEGLDLTTGAGDSNYGIDPSRLLEQSLITEDDQTFGNVPRQAAQQQLSNSNSSTPNMSTWAGSIQRNETGYTSPIFNTSKFLSLCYVKERDCFNCAICKNDYKNRKSMSRHLREQHVQGNIYKCIPCDVGFKRREKLIKHNRDKHPE